MQHAQSEKKGETRERIIQAAKDVFAEQGFAGARVDEIASRAGVNKAALYYHIGDKQALYAEVLHDVIGATAARLSKDIAAQTDPEQKLRAYIRSFAAALDANPQMPRIMMREIASDGVNLPQVFFDDIALILQSVVGIIDEGAKAGVFVKTVPVLVHTMTVGALIFSKLIGPMVMSHPRIREAVKDMDDDFLAHGNDEIERLVLRSIKQSGSSRR
jgi:AcrR family transcriptional regulator